MTAVGCELYEGLARYQWWMRRLRGARAGAALEMHKRLCPPAPGTDGPGTGDAWHAWLWQRLQPPTDGKIADVGCGFGASTLHFAQRQPGKFVGFGNSAYQLARARSQAAGLALGERCEFRLHHHGARLGERFDAILAVETLLHADDLTAALTALADALQPGARLVSMEDVAIAPNHTPDAVALRTRWGLQELWTSADWSNAAAAAGLRLVESFDLTAQVEPRAEPILARAERNLLRLRRMLPGQRARAAVDAFLGGIALERLYTSGAMRYRCAVLVHEAAR